MIQGLSEKVFFSLFMSIVSIGSVSANDHDCGKGEGVASHEASCPSDRALSGDGSAAMRCSDSYIHDRAMRKYWNQIAAENGDPIGQYNFAMELFSEKGATERRRAIFWLEKSANQGDDLAKELLAEIKSNPDVEIPPAPPSGR